MTEQDIAEIKQGVQELKNRPLSIERTGLYIMVLVTMLTTCDNNDRIDRFYAGSGQPQIQERDVIGETTPDRFYEIDGRKVFLEVDGRPVEDYILD